MDTQWYCPQCTYLNWITSIKCTCCGYNKPGNNKISRVKPQPSNPKTTSQQIISTDAYPLTQWTCNECTCTNWSNVTSCTVCFTPKTTPTTRTSTRSESIFNYVGGASEATPEKPRKQKRRVSPPNLRHAPSLSSSKKWVCPICTYENWPRSSKCVMCNSLPSQYNSLPSQSSSLAISNNDITMYDSSMMEPIGLAPLHVRQIKNKFTTLDVLFLDACKGVLLDDLSSVKSYIQQGGDKGRQLTQDELLVLNEPSKYTVGSTLVHLAVRYIYTIYITY